MRAACCIDRGVLVDFHQETSQCRVCVCLHGGQDCYGGQQVFNRVEAAFLVRRNDFLVVFPAQRFRGSLAARLAPDFSELARHGEKRARRIHALDEDIPQPYVQRILRFEVVDCSKDVGHRPQIQVFCKHVGQLVIGPTRG